MTSKALIMTGDGVTTFSRFDKISIAGMSLADFKF